MKILLRLAIFLIVAQLSAGALAQQNTVEPARKLQWQFSPYTRHFFPSEEHRNVVMFGLEREDSTGKLDGGTVFSNSFGQPSLYWYPWGQAYHDFWGVKSLSFKWTAGFLYGYKEPYANKVPLNFDGFSPGAIIAFAYEFKPGWSVQLDWLGTAGLMFQLNFPMQ